MPARHYERVGYLLATAVGDAEREGISVGVALAQGNGRAAAHPVLDGDVVYPGRVSGELGGGVNAG